MERYFKTGDTVYAWSNERYGKSYIVECVVEDIQGDDLILYALYDNRQIIRHRNDVMDYDFLMENIKTITEDHDKEK